jgi:hypothetical protein
MERDVIDGDEVVKLLYKITGFNDETQLIQLHIDGLKRNNSYP